MVQSPVAAKYISSHYEGKTIAVLHDKQYDQPFPQWSGWRHATVLPKKH